MTALLTAEKIKTQIGLDALEVRKSDNGEYWWATLRTNGHTKSVRIQDTATDDDLRRIRDEFDAWMDEEQG